MMTVVCVLMGRYHCYWSVSLWCNPGNSHHKKSL